jgi:hypothetical protein
MHVHVLFATPQLIARYEEPKGRNDNTEAATATSFIFSSVQVTGNTSYSSQYFVGNEEARGCGNVQLSQGIVVREECIDKVHPNIQCYKEQHNALSRFCRSTCLFMLSRDRFAERPTICSILNFSP